MKASRETRKPKGTILVVDDEEDFRQDIAETLEQAGYRVVQASTPQAGLKLAQAQPLDLAIVDLVMPEMSGIELMRELKRLDALMQIIILTGCGSIESAVEAMRTGAFEYLLKPVRLDELEVVIERANETGRLARQNRAFQAAQRREFTLDVKSVIAKSQAMKRVIEEAEALSRLSKPVLVHGETGTGKEVVARLIHGNSDRCEMPLTVVNCSALPDHLLDAELFGHEKGTFTGADESRPGMIEVSNGGTLFLDEIGDMPLEAQTRLLRFLENGTCRRLGSRVERVVDARVIAATNRKLQEAIDQGLFRADLYHRLRVYEIEIPPLRNRPDDILPLAEAVLGGPVAHHREPIELNDAACEAMLSYAWPGNVRELLNTVERAAFRAGMANETQITAAHLDLCKPTERVPDQVLDLDTVVKTTQRAHVTKVLTIAGGHRKQAAQLLGVSERKLYRLVAELDAVDEIEENAGDLNDTSPGS